MLHTISILVPTVLLAMPLLFFTGCKAPSDDSSDASSGTRETPAASIDSSEVNRSSQSDTISADVQDRMKSSSSSQETSEAASTSSQPASSSAQEPIDKVALVTELGDAIMGPGVASAQQMAELFHAHGAQYPAEIYEPAGAATIEDFCALCIEEATEEGVRPEVLFAQAMHETGWLGFGGQVSPDQCNFGGLGALTSGGEGEYFADVRTGLRAQVQHLVAYATTNEPVHEIVDPRFELVSRGVAPSVYDLNGRWAWPGDGYGEAIMQIVWDISYEDTQG